MTRIVLADLGYDCIDVDTVAAALAGIESFRPDTILYEWRLKRRDNYGLARTLRTTASQYVHAPSIVALSVLDEPDGFQAHEEIDAYMTKPFDARALDALLAHVGPAQARRRIAF